MCCKTKFAKSMPISQLNQHLIMNAFYDLVLCMVLFYKSLKLKPDSDAQNWVMLELYLVTDNESSQGQLPCVDVWFKSPQDLHQALAEPPVVQY